MRWRNWPQLRMRDRFLLSWHNVFLSPKRRDCRIFTYLTVGLTLAIVLLYHISRNGDREDVFPYHDSPDLPTAEKELVFAAMRDSDMSWVDEHLNGWRANIYRVDDATSNLTVSRNKGREAMAYLTLVETCLPSLYRTYLLKLV
jgi:hypothetical protein